MEQRQNMLSMIYRDGREDLRLIKSRQGQLEYRTTMAQIATFSKVGDRVLEIGAGTGRYAIALAKAGYDVHALELVEDNLVVMRANAQGVQGIQIEQGDALDLSRYDNDSFDLTLLLGPMYHLYDEADQHKALDEAIRVTKPGGTVLIAILSIYAVMYTNYLNQNFAIGMQENYTEDYQVKHFTEQGFTAFDVNEFEAMLADKPIHHIKTVATDGILELAEGRYDFGLSDEDFEAFCAYHIRFCDKRELLGASSHLLYIGRKNDR